MSAVLALKETKSYQPIAYYSKKLDPVAQGLPPCVMAVTAAAEAVSSSADVVLFHPLTLHVNHDVYALLQQVKINFLSPARHLHCMTVLLSQPHLEIVHCTVLTL